MAIQKGAECHIMDKDDDALQMIHSTNKRYYSVNQIYYYSLDYFTVPGTGTGLLD